MSIWAGWVLGWLPHTLGPMSVFQEPIREACPGECGGDGTDHHMDTAEIHRACGVGQFLV